MYSLRLRAQCISFFCHYDYLFSTLCSIWCLGNVTQRPSILFSFEAILETPLVMYGEQRLVSDGVFLYALSGYDITRTYDITIHRFNPIFKIWEIMHQATHSSIQRNFYHPPREKCVIYYDKKIFVFPNSRDLRMNDFAVSFNICNFILAIVSFSLM